MEHKLITGGEQYLPFARSRIKAMRATGLMFASQQFEIDGCSIKVRIEGDHEFITLSGGGHVSAFPDIQYPEIDVVKSKIRGGVLYRGTFPATVIDSGGYYPTAARRTRFGTSPYNAHHLRKSQNVVTEFSGSIYGHTTRAGVIIGGTSYYDVFMDGTHVERVTTNSPWGGGNGTLASWESNSSEFTPCVVSGNTAVLATIDVTSTESKYVEGGNYGPEGEQLFDGSSGIRGSGQSLIKLRMVCRERDGSGVSYENVVVAQLAYTRDIYIHVFDTPFDSGYAEEVDSDISITNDVERSIGYRRWHASERISTGPNNAVFVLRETNTTYINDVRWSQPPIYIGQTSTFTRGYALSFVAPDRQVQNHVITGDLGSHGYIDGIFPSGDNKHAYVYYGLHDASEALTIDATTLQTFTPTLYNEYLDEIKIEKTGDTYKISKERTISLGQITLRAEDEGETHRSDHYASKLHGASLAVGGYIWADRYCYKLSTGEFAEIPDFAEYPVNPFLNPVLIRLPDQITCPENDRTSYLKVSGNGTQAMYIMFHSGRVACYTARNNADTGALEVVAGATEYTYSAESWSEYLDGQAAQFT